MKKTAKICNITATILIFVVIIAALPMVVPRLLGYQMYGVLSGSMEPTFPIGSVVYVKPAEPQSVFEGDAITFKIGDDVVATHRVVSVDEEGQTFTTKGDANDAVDLEPIKFNRLIGKAEFCIPYLGNLAQFIQSPAGMTTAGGAVALVFILWIVADVLNKKARKKQEEEKLS